LIGTSQASPRRGKQQMAHSDFVKSGADVDRQTIADFGDQWTRYTDNSGYYGSLGLLADICEPLLSADDVRGRVIADIGSGTGRIANMLLDAGAAHVTAIEPSESYKVVAGNTAGRAERIEVIHGKGTEIPQNRNFDLVLSIGVLHHVQNPGPIVQAARRALKPGGTMFVWLYGREGNETYLALVEPLRAATMRLPHVVLEGLCYTLDLVAIGYTAVSRILPLPMRQYMQTVYSRLAPDKRRLVIYDQLNPAYAKYYREDEARALLEDNGFRHVRTHHRHGYSWSVTGLR
jgi:SAM-dependent methyltransferase